MRNRTKARAWALQVLYAWEVRGEREPLLELERDLARLRFSRSRPEIREYAHRLLESVSGRRDQIDRRVEALSANWRLSRMTTVDRNLLRLAAGEMMFVDDVPRRVALHEAIRLAEWFGTEESARFINGVLDALLHELERESLPDPR